jgi:hypothetical protein
VGAAGLRLARPCEERGVRMPSSPGPPPPPPLPLCRSAAVWARQAVGARLTPVDGTVPLEVELPTLNVAELREFFTEDPSACTQPRETWGPAQSVGATSERNRSPPLPRLLTPQRSQLLSSVLRRLWAGDPQGLAPTATAFVVTEPPLPHPTSRHTECPSSVHAT